MIDLAKIREAAGLTRVQVAERLGRAGGTSAASNIKQMEERTSWRLSALIDYIEACGGQAELIVEVNGETLRFTLTSGVGAN